MKFYKALFLLATLSLTFANNIEVSDVEDEVSNNAVAPVNEISDVEPEFNHNAAPLESALLKTLEADAELNGAENIPEVLSDDETPVTQPNETTPVVQNAVPTKPGAETEENKVNGAEETANEVNDADENANETTGADENVNESTGADENVNDAAEASDDYDDNAPVEADADADAGEGSDDYEENAPVSAANGVDVNDATDAADANEAPEESEADDEVDNGTIAAAIGGAAVLSSAGIFIYIRKSKRSGLQSVRTQITMV